MRFEELILSMGSNEARVVFDDHLTVFAGLPEAARSELVDSIVAGALGTRSDTVLVTTDAQGRRLTGAASKGGANHDASAPTAVADLVDDPDLLRRNLAVTGTDLGRSRTTDEPTERATPPATEDLDLVEARSVRAHLQSEVRAAEAAVADPQATGELAELELRLAESDESERRLAHQRAVEALAKVEAELAEIDERARFEAGDRTVTEATDRFRRLQEQIRAIRADAEDGPLALAWATGLLGPHPNPAPLDTVAYPELAALGEQLRTALAEVERTARAVADHHDDVVDPGLDRRVGLLAPLDQDALWAAHARVTEAEARFDAAVHASATQDDDLPPDIEADIDAAHIERIQTEEVVADRWRPGVLGSSIPAALGLAFAATGAVVPSTLLIVVALVVAGLLLVRPRRALSQAIRLESEQLARAGADSYLGLHLRRLADPDDEDAQRLLEKIAQERTLAMVAWKQLVGHLDPAEATGLEDEIRTQATRFNADLRGAAQHQLEEASTAARTELNDCRRALQAATRDLEGRIAHTARDLERAIKAATTALGVLGIEGDPEAPATNEAVAGVRLEATRRNQLREAARDRDMVYEERAALVAEVTRTHRPEWDGLPPATEAPLGISLLRRRRDELVARRREIEMQLADLVALLDASDARVRALEEDQPDDEEPGELVRQRLLHRLARNLRLGPASDEMLPVILDDPLLGMDPEWSTDIMDVVLRVAERVQVIYLTDDPAVVAWARKGAAANALTLLESAVEVESV